MWVSHRVVASSISVSLISTTPCGGSRARPSARRVEIANRLTRATRSGSDDVRPRQRPTDGHDPRGKSVRTAERSKSTLERDLDAAGKGLESLADLGRSGGIQSVDIDILEL